MSRRAKHAFRYRITSEAMFTSPEWTNLPTGPASSPLLILYLAAGPLQRRVPGVVHAGEGELSDKLGWSVPALRKCIREIEAAGAGKFDRDARFFFLDWRFRDEPPSSPDVVRGWRKEMESWPPCDLAKHARQSLLEKLRQMGPEFAAALEPAEQTVPSGSALTLPGDPPPSPTPGSPRGDQRFRDSEIQKAGPAAPAAAALDLAQRINAEWPDLKAEPEAAAAWERAFPDVDLVAETQTARAHWASNGGASRKPGDFPTAFLNRWFKNAKNGPPIGQRVSASVQQIPERNRIEETRQRLEGREEVLRQVDRERRDRGGKAPRLASLQAVSK